MISVVLPTYNEREGVGELIDEVLGVCRSAGLEAEVVVVDDDSPDGTATHLLATYRQEPRVRVHLRKGERGLATAIRKGLELARGEVVVVMDSDGNHDPALVPLMARLTEEFDVVVGSRYVLGGGMLTSRLRYWLSYAFNLLVRAVLGLRVHDSLSGYLAFRPRILDRLQPGSVFYGYGDYAIRFLYTLVRQGCRVIEVPTVYRFRKGGESKTRFLAYFWTYLASVLRLRLLGR